MQNDVFQHPALTGAIAPPPQPWLTFEQILRRLHTEGIYIHADQLAEFFLVHGLPVHLQYVPPHLHTKAQVINQHYQGDMAVLTEERESLF
jgi:hypothetical protein